GSSRNQIMFDHDHFREFFLGEQLGIYLAEAAKSDLRKMLRADVLPDWALDAAVSVALQKGVSAEVLMKAAIETAQSESPASFARENCGGLCVRLLEHAKQEKFEIEEVTFPGDAF